MHSKTWPKLHSAPGQLRGCAPVGQLRRVLVKKVDDDDPSMLHVQFRDKGCQAAWVGAGDESWRVPVDRLFFYNLPPQTLIDIHVDTHAPRGVGPDDPAEPAGPTPGGEAADEQAHTYTASDAVGRVARVLNTQPSGSGLPKSGPRAPGS